MRKMKIDAIPLNLNYKINYPDEFLNKLKEGEIVASRCNNCGAIYFPPQKDCYNCGKSEMSNITLPKEGEIMTFSKVIQKPQGFEKYPDYVIGIIKVGDVNLMVWIVGEPKVGKKVKITTDGIRVIGKVIE